MAKTSKVQITLATIRSAVSVQTIHSCEIGPGKSVSVSSTIGITDLIVGSVQPAAEVFQLYAATTGTTLDSGDLIDTYSSDGGKNIDGTATVACPNYDGSNTCTFDFSTPYSVVGIVELAGIPNTTTPTEQNASNSLITAVSLVPAPPIGHGLPAVIAVGGLLFGVWAWDRSKKRRLLGAPPSRTLPPDAPTNRQK